jgi:hypothetical protein
MQSYKKNFIDQMTDIRKKDSFTINVTRYFCNAEGHVVAYNTLPAVMQTKYPFYIFGKYDFDGAYKVANQIVPPQNGCYYLYTFVKGSAFDYIGFQIGNNVSALIQPGSIVSVYCDNVANPSWLVYVVVSCPFQSYASILQNVQRNFLIKSFLYNADNPINYNETIFSIILNPIGQFLSEQYQPLSFKQVQDEQANFIRVPLSFEPDFLHGLASNIDLQANTLNFQLEILI